MQYPNIKNWKPNAKSRAILDRSMEHINGAPYKVSLRWVFYRIWQEGFYSQDKPEAKKKAYDNFDQLLNRARHSGIWPKDIVVDETRTMEAFDPDGGNHQPDMDYLVRESIADARRDLEYYREQLDNYRYDSLYQVDPNYLQSNYVAVMFEARAMVQQFREYTDGVTLVPFGGQPSITYKYQVAKYLEAKGRFYDKPIVLLYFGDLDESGKTIYESGAGDIAEWCNHPIEIVHCGLTQ